MPSSPDGTPSSGHKADCPHVQRSLIMAENDAIRMSAIETRHHGLEWLALAQTRRRGRE
jgi:hypothetical protein